MTSENSIASLSRNFLNPLAKNLSEFALYWMGTKRGRALEWPSKVLPSKGLLKYVVFMHRNEGNVLKEKMFCEESFEYKEWDGFLFENCDFTGAVFKSCVFLDCHFVSCNLSNVSLLNSRFNSCKFEGSKIIGVNWSEVKSSSFLEFIESTLNYSIFSSMKLPNTVFRGCLLREVDFSQSDLKGSDFQDSDFSGANFSGSNLSQADFRSARNYAINPSFSQIKKAKFSLPEVVSLLSAFDIEIE